MAGDNQSDVLKGTTADDRAAYAPPSVGDEYDRDQEDARRRARMELEDTLVAQEVRAEQGTGVPIEEQAYGSGQRLADGEGMFTVDEGAGKGPNMMGDIPDRRTIDEDQN